MAKIRNLTQEQAVHIGVAGMFGKADRKLSRKFRRRGKTVEAESAERRIRLSRQALNPFT